jgi:L-aspartate oxidase
LTLYSLDSLDSTDTIPAYFDVVIIGGGAAGLYTALCLSESLKIGLITKDNLTLSASDWAQGGIAAAIGSRLV